MIARWVVAGAVTLGAGPAYADDDCVRISVEVWRSLAEDRDSDTFGVVGERNLGRFALRGRIARGFLGHAKGGDYPPGVEVPIGDATLWSATLGVDARADATTDGSIAMFLGLAAGVVRLDGGFLTSTEVGAHVMLQVGIELRNARLRTRPTLGLGMMVGGLEGEQVLTMPGIGIGVEIAL